MFLINPLCHNYTSICIKDCVCRYINRVSTIPAQVEKNPLTPSVPCQSNQSPTLKCHRHIWKRPQPITVSVYDPLVSQTLIDQYVEEFMDTYRSLWLYIYESGGWQFGPRCLTLGVTSYFSEPTRLRSSSGHWVDWRTGLDCQHAGSFTHRVKFEVSVVSMGTWPN